MRLRTRVKVAIGVVTIGGILGGLWAAYQPTLPWETAAADLPPPPPRLHDAHATVLVRLAQSDRVLRATIACDGDRRSASGFWADDPGGACDALASTQHGLLSGPGCRRTLRGRDRLHAVGAFGQRRFDHRAQQAGCPDPEAWIAVNALASPVRPTEKELTEPQR
jgi:hypothetical protein